VVYLIGFFMIADYIPELEHWSLMSTVRTICFIPLFGLAMAGLYAYRKQMLEGTYVRRAGVFGILMSGRGAALRRRCTCIDSGRITRKAEVIGSSLV
jgi:hypothetical protein